MSDPRQERRLQMLIGLYRDAAASAFGWAETLRGKASDSFENVESEEEAETRRKKYMAGLPSTEWSAQHPGRDTYLINLAFRDMTQSAEAFEEWGCRLTQAHDDLCKLRP